MDTGYNVRVGDADREAVAAQLREHYADGRITHDELNERLDQTFAAKTRADLNVVTRDLPSATRPSGAPSGATGWPGQQWQCQQWQGPGFPGTMAPTGSRQDDGDQDRSYTRRGMFAPMMGLVWLCVIVGSLFVFGLGGGDRPLAIVLLLAAVALFKRLFGLGRGRRYAGSRGPRGCRGRRGRRR